MARDIGGDIAITVTVEDTQAIASLGRLEEKMHGVTTAAETTGKAIDKQTEQHKSTASAIMNAASSFERYISTLVLSGAAFTAVATVIDKVGAYTRESIKAYAEAERAQSRLTSALRAQQMATPATIASMNQYAQELALTSTYTDDAITDTERLLLQMGVMPSKMKPAIQAVADLASGLGIELSQAAGLVGKALDGNSASLKRYGIHIDEAAFAANGADEVFKRVEERFGGQAQDELNTYTGKVKNLSKAFGEIQESFGKFIMSNPMFQFGTNALGASANKLNAGVDKGMPSSLAAAWLSMFGPAASSQAAAIAGMEYLASAYNENTPLPPKAGLGFDPGMLGALTGGLDIDKQMYELRHKKKAKVIPFERPQLMGESDWNSSAIYQAGWFNDAGRLPGIGPGTFPGWDQPFAGQFKGGLPLSRYMDQSVYPDRPTRPGFMDGAGGRFLGAGIGALGSFIPGMSAQGSMLGSSFGSALGGLKSVTGLMGSFAPMLGPIMGIAGGLLGKLFGPSQSEKDAKETNTARSSFISDFGGMGSLQETADKVGFSLDKMLATKKVSDFQAEVKKLETAMNDFDAKVAASNQELSDMYGELDRTIAKASELGYQVDSSGKLIGVNFQKMQEVAQRYGMDLASLGPSFQSARLHDAASQIINDFTLLNLGGTDTGTILSGMSDKISKLVQDSIKFGTDIPANMEPWIKELIRSGQLTDENGVKITDVTKIKFGDPIKTEWEKVTTTMQDLIGKIDALITKIGDVAAGVNSIPDRTVHIGFSVDEPPDLSDFGIGEARPMSRGGFVPYPKYLAGGGFISRGTDSVPAMLTPGEGVLRREAVSRLMRGDWPSGGGNGLTVSIDNVTVGSGADSERDLELQLGRAMVRGLKRKGVRLNAA